MTDDEYHVALCSGGSDSVAATHAAMTFGPAEEVVFADTTTAPANCYTAIDATIDWIREWCHSNGWEFTVTRPPTPFKEIVAEEGYPGPSRHYLMYRRLKDRAFDAYQQQFDADVHFWTGIRRFESENRMAVAEPEGERGDSRWFWRSPFVNFTDDRLAEYLDRFDLEPAPVVESIGRSADCWCGCFGDPMELIDLAAAGFEAHAEWLETLETPDGCPREQARWAGYNWEKHDYAADDDRQMTLCSSCDRAKTDGGIDR